MASLSIAPLLNKINEHILNPVIIFLFAVAVLVFFWGIFQFLMHSEGSSDRETGKRNMLYGLIGMFIMVGVFGIIRLIMGTLGLDSTPYLSL